MHVTGQITVPLQTSPTWDLSPAIAQRANGIERWQPGKTGVPLRRSRMYPLAPSRARKGQKPEQGTWQPQSLLATWAAVGHANGKPVLAANIACPRCSRAALLDPKLHAIDQHGCTPEWRCPGLCGFRDRLNLHGWTSPIAELAG